MIWTTLILDFIVEIIWPLAAIISLVMFRRQLRRLIDRIKSFEIPGLKLKVEVLELLTHEAKPTITDVEVDAEGRDTLPLFEPDTNQKDDGSIAPIIELRGRDDQ